MDVGSLISASLAFSKSRLIIWKFSVHVLLKPYLENFEHYFASMWDECNCAVVWTFFRIAFLWDQNENWSFLILWLLLSFSNLLAYWVWTFTAWSFRIWNSSAGIPSTPLALFVVMLPKVTLTSHSRISGYRWGTQSLTPPLTTLLNFIVITPLLHFIVLQFGAISIDPSLNILVHVSWWTYVLIYRVHTWE